MLFNQSYLDLSNYVSILCVVIPSWVFIMLYWQVLSSSWGALLQSEDNLVEFVWTLVPTIFVGILCYLNIHCIVYEAFRQVDRVVKIVGRQWYWDYELVGGSAEQVLYHSYMGDYIDSVDKPLRLEYKNNYTLLVTSADVLHSFSLPGFNLKVDAVPGRINQAQLTPDRLGAFVGYCSELCGAGHAYMPIVVEVVNSNIYNSSVLESNATGFSYRWVRRIFG